MRDLVCRSPAMRRLKTRLPRASDLRAGALVIHGEAGVGKRFVARLVHRRRLQGRRTKRIVEIDLPADHHEAMRTWESAEAGAIIVSGVDGLEDVVRRQLSTDTFVILIAHGPLDLRSIVPIRDLEVPPLRSRTEDFPELVERLAARGDHGQPIVTATAMDCLLAYAWPGNVRELQSVLRHAALAAGGDPIDRAHLPHRVRRSTPADPGLPLETAVRNHILATLKENRGNRRATARALQISRSALYRRLLRYEVAPGRDFHDRGR